MSKLYLIGGGSGTGKSTIASALAERHGLECLKCDDLVGPHQAEAARRHYPVNKAIDSIPSGQERLKLLQLNYKEELARQEELFVLLTEELKRRRFDKLIIEGNCLLPDLVSKQLRPTAAVWLVPTPEFQQEIYPKRDWLGEVIGGQPDKQTIIQSWIERDRKFNKTVLGRCDSLSLPTLLVDGQRSISSVRQWAANQLGL